MVQTRTQTGVITKQHYDPKTLAEHESIPSAPITYGSPPLKPHKPGRVNKTKNTTTKSKSKKGYKTKPKGETPDSPTSYAKRLLTELKGEGRTIRVQGDLREGIPSFFPQTVFGAHEEIGKSKIQRAECKIAQWEEIREAHRDHYPRIIPYLDAKIQEAREARARLEDNEENNQIGVKDIAATEITKRLETLEWGLKTSRFEAEAENIRGAIEGYKSGAIPYSEKYTLIYAGKIVDNAATYGEFVVDRQLRLDRYAETYGSHWLWYESPLRIHAEARPRIARCAVLTQDSGVSGMQSWHVNEAFWKRSKWVSRLPDSIEGEGEGEEEARGTKFQKRENGEVYCQEDGPKLVFRTLLDSGATMPCLTASDISALGIEKDTYACQTIERISLVTHEETCRIYEMYVEIVTDDNKSLVDEKSEKSERSSSSSSPLVHYNHHQSSYMGGLCPVIEGPIQIQYDDNGIDTTCRLSGMLPFLACYVSSTPSRPYLFLGEDRKDVLGAHKMEGQQRWEIGTRITRPEPGSYLWDCQFGDPVVRFSHRQGSFVDEDLFEAEGIMGHRIVLNMGSEREWSFVFPVVPVLSGQVPISRQSPKTA